MTTLNRVNSYPRSYNDFDEEEEEIAPSDLHPTIRRQAQRIVHRERMARLTQWWISLVGALVICGEVVALVLALLGQPLIAAAAAIGAGMGVLYLVGLALKGMERG